MRALWKIDLCQISSLIKYCWNKKIIKKLHKHCFQDENGTEKKSKKREKAKGESKEKAKEGEKKEKKKKKKKPVEEDEVEGMNDLEKFLADENSGGGGNYEAF